MMETSCRHPIVDKAIDELKEDIADLTARITLLESLNISQAVSEEEWHNLCETPLRSTAIMGALVQHIFPDATDIKVDCNYVNFNLFGFCVQIPTSRARGINVDTSWYVPLSAKGSLRFEDFLSDKEMCVLRYLHARAGKEKLKTRIALRMACRERFLLLHKSEWEERLNRKRERFDFKIADWERKHKESRQTAMRMRDELLPVLNRFSTVHKPFSSNSWAKTPEQILEAEGLMDNPRENNLRN